MCVLFSSFTVWFGLFSPFNFHFCFFFRAQRFENFSFLFWFVFFFSVVVSFYFPISPFGKRTAAGTSRKIRKSFERSDKLREMESSIRMDLLEAVVVVDRLETMPET